MKSMTNYTKGEIMDRNKYIGICKVGEKGQVVIPKEIRKMFWPATGWKRQEL